MAIVPLALWAVPAIPRPSSFLCNWTDNGGNLVTQWTVRRGFDRYGVVLEQQFLSWGAPTAEGLTELRAKHAHDTRSLIDLPPTDSWKVQFHLYGNNHTFQPNGLYFIDSGRLWTVPYSVMVAMLAGPGVVWGIVAAARRLRG